MYNIYFVWNATYEKGQFVIKQRCGLFTANGNTIIAKSINPNSAARQTAHVFAVAPYKYSNNTMSDGWNGEYCKKNGSLHTQISVTNNRLIIEEQEVMKTYDKKINDYRYASEFDDKIKEDSVILLRVTEFASNSKILGSISCDVPHDENNNPVEFDYNVNEYKDNHYYKSQDEIYDDGLVWCSARESVDKYLSCHYPVSSDQ